MITDAFSSISPSTVAMRPPLGLLTRVRFSVLGRGIVGRELFAASPALLALAILPSLVLVVLQCIPHRNDLSSGNAYGEWTLVVLYMLPLVFGVLGGAEEEENGTADFIYRLPLPRWRIFVEKIIAALLSSVIWIVLIIFLLFIVSLVLHPSVAFIRGYRDVIHSLFSFNLVAFSELIWLPTLYCVSLASGLWLRRVLLASIATAGLMLLVACLIFAVQSHPTVFFVKLNRSAQDVTAFLLITLALGFVNLGSLYLAWFRIQTREGR